MAQKGTNNRISKLFLDPRMSVLFASAISMVPICTLKNLTSSLLFALYHLQQCVKSNFSDICFPNYSYGCHDVNSLHARWCGSWRCNTKIETHTHLTRLWQYAEPLVKPSLCIGFHDWSRRFVWSTQSGPRKQHYHQLTSKPDKMALYWSVGACWGKRRLSLSGLGFSSLFPNRGIYHNNQCKRQCTRCSKSFFEMFGKNIRLSANQWLVSAHIYLGQTQTK